MLRDPACTFNSGYRFIAADEIERLTRENRSMNETISRLSMDLARCSSVETSGWQPIETAPLEGAHVLVVDSGEVSEARHIEGHGWYLAQNDPTDSWGPGPLNPTHWMQLPCPPGTRPRPSSSVEPPARTAIEGDLVPDHWWRVHRELANGHISAALAVVAAVIEDRPLPECAACDVTKLAINAEKAEVCPKCGERTDNYPVGSYHLCNR